MMGSMTKALPLLVILLSAMIMTGCGASVRNIPFKINSEPEGAHLIYKLSHPQDKSPSADWIYLGNTPFQGVRGINEDLLVDSTKITIKVMRAGYYDQIMEWDGASILEETETKGQITWSPRLSPQ